MLNKRWTVCAAAALLYGGTVAAQQPGTLLLGGFAQYTMFDNSETNLKNLDDSWGGGGRIGVFITPRLSADVEGSFTQASNKVAGVPKTKYGPIAARLTYGLPIFTRTQLLIGGGAVLSSFHNDAGYYMYGYGASGDLGLRIGLTNAVAVRGDAIADYQFTQPTFTNFRFQAGLEFMPDIASMLGMGATAQPVDWMGPMTQPLPGTVELKGFGQWNYFDNKLHLDHGGASAFGGGAGLGVFLTPKWEIEGDGSYARPKTTSSAPEGAGVEYHAADFSLRADYNIPVWSRSQIIIGAGVTRLGFHPVDATVPGTGRLNTYDFGPEGLLGVRFGFANRLALRVDGLVNYITGDLKTTDFAVRAGLSYFLGGASRAVPETTVTAPPPPPPPPPPPADTSHPAPPPPPPPPPAPAPVDTTKITAPIYFDFDKSVIRSDAQATLDAKIPYFQANPALRVRIEGNCDERGSDEYNLALGQRRAAAAKKYLTDHGVDAGRLDIVSYGEERPVCKDHDESCWSQNRRDDFRIVAGGDSLKAP